MMLSIAHASQFDACIMSALPASLVALEQGECALSTGEADRCGFAMEPGMLETRHAGSAGLRLLRGKGFGR
jgi:hypothetical protein